MLCLFACKGKVDYRNEAHRTVVNDTIIVYVPDTIKSVMHFHGHPYIDSLGRQHYTLMLPKPIHRRWAHSIGRINRIRITDARWGLTKYQLDSTFNADTTTR